MSLRRRLILTVAAGALSACAAAQAQGSRGGPRFVTHNWGVTTSLNYSNNFARIADTPYERRFLLPDETFISTPVVIEGPEGPEVIAVPISDTVDLGDPPGKLFGTVTLNGASVVRRARLEGLVRGRVQVGHYFDEKTLREETFEAAQVDRPDVAIENDAIGYIGDPGFRRTYVDPNINGIASVELYDNKLLLDAGGFLQEQSLFRGGELLAQAPGQEINEVTYGGVFLSPVWTTSFADGQGIELRYRNSSVFVVSENITDPVALDSRRLSNDSVSNEVSLDYMTGSRFGSLVFQYSAFARQFEEDGGALAPDQKVEQLSTSLAAQYRISPVVKVEAKLGYDSVSSEFDEPDPDLGFDEGAFREGDLSGVFFTVGATYAPTQRSQVSAAIGRRYNGTQISASATLPLSNRITFNATANRTLTSGLQEQQNSNFIGNSRSLGLIEQLNRRGGLSDPGLSRIADFQLNDGLGGGGTAGRFGIRPTTNVRAALRGNFGRTQASAQFSATLPDSDGGGRGEQYRYGARVSRQLSRTLNVGISADSFVSRGGRFSLTGGDTGEITQLRLNADVSYRLGRNWQLTGGVTHLERSADPSPETASLFGGTRLEFEEQQVRFGVRYDF